MSQSEAPQTDDLAAVEQWHENQEVHAPAQHIAISGPVGIECPHGWDACPACDEVRP